MTDHAYFHPYIHFPMGLLQLLQTCPTSIYQWKTWVIMFVCCPFTIWCKLLYNHMHLSLIIMYVILIVLYICYCLITINLTEIIIMHSDESFLTYIMDILVLCNIFLLAKLLYNLKCPYETFYGKCDILGSFLR